jgi:hypothetical protein
MSRFMVCVALLALGSTVSAAPVLVTKDNYQSAGDSPFDLAGGGFYLEDFEDGLVNTPGLSTGGNGDPFFAVDIIGPPTGVSIDAGGNAARPHTSFSDLVGTDYANIEFSFDAAAIGGLPTQVGLVLTQADIVPDDIKLTVYDQSLAIAGEFSASLAANKFLGVTFDQGIKTVILETDTPFPGQPFFQVDHVQYGAVVPEPSAALLLVIGVCSVLYASCPRQPWIRWLRASLAIVLATAGSIALRAMTTSGPPNNYIVNAGGGRDGICLVTASKGPIGSGTLLPSRRHVLTAKHVVTGAPARPSALKPQGAVRTSRLLSLVSIPHLTWQSSSSIHCRQRSRRMNSFAEAQTMCLARLWI